MHNAQVNYPGGVIRGPFYGPLVPAKITMPTCVQLISTFTPSSFGELLLHCLDDSFAKEILSKSFPPMVSSMEALNAGISWKNQSYKLIKPRYFEYLCRLMESRADLSVLCRRF